MELHISRQAAGLALGFAFGLALALIYGILSPPRRAAGRFAAVFDGVYALTVLVSLFTLSMLSPAGKPGLWELSAAGLGGLFYFAILSPHISPVLGHIFHILVKAMKKMQKYLVKVLNLIFQNAE